MANDVVCYVQRDRITDWKRLVLTHDEPAFVYGSNDKRVFASKLGRGSNLWIVSSIPGGSPELVARLRVLAVAKRDDPKLKVSQRLLRHFQEFTWIARGSAKSEFFGHNDAASALLHTVFENRAGSPWRLSKGAKHWHSDYGGKLQRPALIYPAGVAQGGLVPTGGTPFERLAESATRSVFISWKWRDNSKGVVLSLAYALAEQGFMPWLDLLALPRARALDKIQRDAPKLEALLRYGYKRCFAVIRIDSAHYGQPSPCSERNWTLREWSGELAPRKRLLRISFRPTGVPKCQILPAPDVRLESTSPRRVAAELGKWYETAFDIGQPV